MARGSPVLCFVGLLVSWLSVVAAAKQKKVYIVRMRQDLMPSSYSTQSEWYAQSLQSLTSTDDSMVYAYDTAFKGFAAALHPDQADVLSKSDSVLGVYEDKLYSLQTTRSGHFMGLDSAFYSTAPDQGPAKDLNAASQDVIIGVLDTGVWPESKSFDDTGMRPVPSGWLGECEISEDFPAKSCNKKLIGARSFSSGVQVLSQAAGNVTFSPRDTNGHGSHTASTAAGAPVEGANLFGFANGTAQGMAPQARLAAYKVCWAAGCAGSDILAAMEKAISDGVHVLSLSLGGSNEAYYNDPVSMGAFAAIEKGIFVSASAGNSGPRSMSLSNVAPWVTTVGAGSIDRDFPAYVQLGNGVRFTGVSLYSGKGMGTKPAEVVYAVGPRSTSNLCLPGTLNPMTAKGKVVVCDRGVNSRVEKGAVVRDVGGVGMILANTPDNGGEELVADSHLLPAVTVGAKAGVKIRAYARSGNAKALLSFGGTVLNVKPAPVVAAFSSRGPNTLTPEILKPDLIGPGVNILAAWTEAASPSSLEVDPRRTPFNIISGTSMSCPHISGLAALMKAAHPDWSPSAIKSALMTTAYTVDNSRAPLRDEAEGLKSNPWAHGSGYVDPPKALSPGLVYDIETEDYVSFICSLGYTPAQVSSIVKRQVSCATKFADPGQLNYPSFSVNFNVSREVVRYSRVLKNVGTTRSGYRVVVNAPPTVTVRVRPSTLIFRHPGEKKPYRVTFSSNKGLSQTSDADAFGSIAWVNSEHVVTSPVAFTWTS